MKDLWQSYKRLPGRYKIAIGVIGITVGLSGPTLMDNFTNFLNKVCANLSDNTVDVDFSLIVIRSKEMAANTLSYDNIMTGASNPSPSKVVVLGCCYQLPQGIIILTEK